MNIKKSSMQIAKWCLYILLAYLPFHVFISLSLGTSIGYLDVFKNWYNLLVPIGLLAALVGAPAKDLKALTRKPLILLILLYGLVHTVYLALFSIDQDAELIGYVHNLRFLGVFLIALMVQKYNPNAKQITRKIILLTSIAVATFGLVQYFVLPDDFLEMFGYSAENGTFPVFYIDAKEGFERVHSTIKDPNSLGAFLLLPIALQAKRLLASRSRRDAIITSAMVLCLLLTFSRSSLLGLIFMAASYGALRYGSTLKSFLSSSRGFLASGLLAVALIGGVLLVNSNDIVRNLVLHEDDVTTLESPTDLRLELYTMFTTSLFTNPEGNGVGTAGLASIINDTQGTVLTENYFLQIGYEVGLFGLILFIAILGYIARLLLAGKEYDSALFALGGVLVASMFLHTLTNPAVSIVLFIYLGLIYGGALEPPSNHSGKI